MDGNIGCALGIAAFAAIGWALWNDHHVTREINRINENVESMVQKEEFGIATEAPNVNEHPQNQLPKKVSSVEKRES